MGSVLWQRGWKESPRLPVPGRRRQSGSRLLVGGRGVSRARSSYFRAASEPDEAGLWDLGSASRDVTGSLTVAAQLPHSERTPTPSSPRGQMD